VISDLDRSAELFTYYEMQRVAKRRREPVSREWKSNVSVPFLKLRRAIIAASLVSLYEPLAGTRILFNRALRRPVFFLKP
jgi:ABC-type Na+ transport system ATPase subunit NatA